jgi:ABC-type Mn2+/Zn2+ transport system permease subunit
MPTPLPLKTLAKTSRTSHTLDALELWAIILGLAAVALASFVYFATRDATGAAFVLLATAGIAFVVLRASNYTSERG